MGECILLHCILIKPVVFVIVVTVLRFPVTFISLLGDKLYKVNYLLENISFSFPVEVAKSEKLGSAVTILMWSPLMIPTHILCKNTSLPSVIASLMFLQLPKELFVKEFPSFGFW